MLVRLEVTVEIDDDQLEELELQGNQPADIDGKISRAITLVGSNLRQPVNDIYDVRVVKYID